MMRTAIRLCPLLAVLVLMGCGLAQGVASDALAYHETADVTANSIILLNVLRAKDNSPLHFGELSLQHGQISEQGGVLLTQPIGGIPHSTSLPRSTIVPSATVGDQVAFDLGTLDTQTFTQGVTAPIAPKMLKYFLDSGVDYRLVVMLLVAGVVPPGGREAIANFPRSDREVCYPGGYPPLGTMPVNYQMRALDESEADCHDNEREFVAFLRVLNGLRRIYAVSYRPFTPIGAPFRPDAAHSLHDLLALDPAKEELRAAPGGRLQLGLRGTEDRIVLCEEAPAGTANVAGPGKDPEGTPRAICGAKNASLVSTDNQQQQAASDIPNFTLRSTLGIFSFLGQVLGSQERRSKPARDVCIRLDPQSANQADPDCNTGQVLFHLSHDRTGARFGVEYDGEYWGVPNARPCSNERNSCDHTLETLSMLSLLLNLNKSARDIPSTPAVQLVP